MWQNNIIFLILQIIFFYSLIFFHSFPHFSCCFIYFPYNQMLFQFQCTRTLLYFDYVLCTLMYFYNE